MHVAIYDDSPIFGGHEAMAAEAAIALARVPGSKVTFIANRYNLRLQEKLAVERATGLTIVLTDIAGKTLQGFRSLLSPKAVAKIQALLRRIAPDVLIVAQGSIEMCTVGLLAAKNLPMRAISYIPYAHTFVTTSSILGPIRDAFNPFYYKLPDSYITVAPSCANMLQERGVRAPIEVVYNGVATKQFTGDIMKIREKWGIRSGEKALGIVGRIACKHKGHDFLVKTIATHREQLSDMLLVVAGDGPDAQRLMNLVKVLNLTDRVVLLPWQSDLSAIYTSLDALVVPSRYEGMPLVMLEAMRTGLPVIASNRDGMADVLSPQWLFAYGDQDALFSRIRYVLDQPDRDEVDRNKERSDSHFTPEAFARSFVSAVNRLVGVAPCA